MAATLHMTFFKYISFNAFFHILIHSSLKFAPLGADDDKPTLVQVMA